MKIAEGHQALMPYLMLNNASEFADWMKTIFNAEPGITHFHEDGSVQHGEITVNGMVMMYSQARAEYPAVNTHFFIYVDDADKYYAAALAHGASSARPLTDQPYGRSGGVKDPFGLTWWITSL
jgi:PhnB protein